MLLHDLRAHFTDPRARCREGVCVNGFDQPARIPAHYVAVVDHVNCPGMSCCG